MWERYGNVKTTGAVIYLGHSSPIKDIVTPAEKQGVSNPLKLKRPPLKLKCESFCSSLFIR